jgi:hypothetical protein
VVASLRHNLLPRNDYQLPGWEHFCIGRAAELVEFTVAIREIPAYQRRQGAIPDIPQSKPVIQVWHLRQNGSIFSHNQLFDFLSDAPMATRSITDVRAAGMSKQKPPARTNDFAVQAVGPVFVCEIGKLEQNPIHLDSVEALVSYLDAPA